MYPLLAALFFLSVLLVVLLLTGLIFQPVFFEKNRRGILRFYCMWFGPYVAFILLLTGPRNLGDYPNPETSPYKLPWAAGVSRFVAQGNRSFTSHRADHEYAWDFVMPNGTEVLAARAGRVKEVVDQYTGIGFNSNYVAIEHDDGTSSYFAHVQKSLVKVGDPIQQGQPLALSGMVGQTIFPHVHFYVRNKEGTASIPISFQDAGVPLAGHFYTSQNQPPK